MRSTRSFAVVAVLLGFLAGAVAPAEAARRGDRGAKKSRSAKKDKTRPAARKKDAPTSKPAEKRAPKRSRRAAASSSADTSLRGRFEKIATPQVPGVSKIRLRWSKGGQGEAGG